MVETSYFSIEFKRSQCTTYNLLVVRERVKEIKSYTPFFNWSCFLLNNVTSAVPHMTYDFNMKMHQFAFVQRCPALTSAALPPPPCTSS